MGAIALIFFALNTDKTVCWHVYTMCMYLYIDKEKTSSRRNCTNFPNCTELLLTLLIFIATSTHRESVTYGIDPKRVFCVFCLYAALPRSLSNSRAIRSLWHPNSWLRDFTRFASKTFYRLVNRDPNCLTCLYYGLHWHLWNVKRSNIF